MFDKDKLKIRKNGWKKSYPHSKCWIAFIRVVTATKNWWNMCTKMVLKRCGDLDANATKPFIKWTIRRADSRVSRTRRCSRVCGRAWFSGSALLREIHNSLAFSIANFGSVATCCHQIFKHYFNQFEWLFIHYNQQLTNSMTYTRTWIHSVPWFFRALASAKVRRVNLFCNFLENLAPCSIVRAALLVGSVLESTVSKFDNQFFICSNKKVELYKLRMNLQ